MMFFQRVGPCGIFILGFVSLSATAEDTADAIIRRGNQLQAGISPHTNFGENALKARSQEVEVNSQGQTRSIKSDDAVIRRPERNGVHAAVITANGEITSTIEEDPAEHEEEKEAATSYDELRSADNDTLGDASECSKGTGGTCSIWPCDASRDSTCSWGSCVCTGVKCAHYGKCWGTGCPSKCTSGRYSKVRPCRNCVSIHGWCGHTQPYCDHGGTRCDHCTAEPTPRPTPEPTLDPTPAPTPAPCSENQHVSDKACVACPAGTRNAAGDDASGSDTGCDAIKCLANQFVSSNSCQPCSAGMINAAGDDASGADTRCDAAPTPLPTPLPTPDPKRPCPADEFQRAALILNCAGASGEKEMDLQKGAAAEVAIVPVGVDGLNISLSADADLDVFVYYPDGTCVAGYRTTCANRGGTKRDAEMDIYFSGDDRTNPVTETIRVTSKITKALDVQVKAFKAGKGTITYAYGVLDPCPSTPAGCVPCSESTKCSSSQTPECDGSSEVQCRSSQ